MAKDTQADVPPVIAADYARARQPEAVAEATGDGYTRTRKLSVPAPNQKQFGLPRTPGKKPKLKV